jgi:hypothetical protein
MKGERKGMMTGTSFGWERRDRSARGSLEKREKAHQRQEGVLDDEAVGL